MKSIFGRIGTFFQNIFKKVSPVFLNILKKIWNVICGIANLLVALFLLIIQIIFPAGLIFMAIGLIVSLFLLFSLKAAAIFASIVLIVAVVIFLLWLIIKK